ncbi:type VI secretion system contractile sheath small subunit [Pseudoxanthomonas putridarboris]|uniref:Type VI secretion system contractile sheath small subunit n=1 Tax=Pseudoxanthomonas putridarboris TaxID=752605 RepID=A0ABU9J539_9GAMM
MSKKDGSVAPKERINIKYVPNTGDQQAEMELPLKLVVVGDFKGHGEEQPLEERESVRIDKHNFDAVLEKAELSLNVDVPDRLSGSGAGSTIGVNLNFKSLKDFTPDAIANQIPELKTLLDLREALVALKGPLGNVPAFRSKLQELLADPKARDKLAKELELVLEKPEGKQG